MRRTNLLRFSAVGVGLLIVSGPYAKPAPPTPAPDETQNKPRAAQPEPPADKQSASAAQQGAAGESAHENSATPTQARADKTTPSPDKPATITPRSGPSHQAKTDTDQATDTADQAPKAAPDSAPAAWTSLTVQTSKQLALGLLAPPAPAWQSVTIGRGDTLSHVFSRTGLDANDWMPLMALGKPVAPLKTLRPGDTVKIQKTADGKLAKLRYPMNAIDTLAVNRDGDTLHAKVLHRPTETRQFTAHGSVDGSLWKSLKKAGVPAKVATHLSRIYSYRLNLSRHVHDGDRFSVIYKADYADDERVDSGPVVAADIDTNSQDLRAFRAEDKNGIARYYDPTGHSYKPSISRHPVAYSRISSAFSHNRMDPVLHVRRPHTGVDMAAARGTPIHAAADGTVKFVGRNGGYGRLVELDHFQNYSTRYGHMSRFAKGLHDGEHVTQGEVIGYVGATGLATGPHLHFEVRKAGVAYNPMTMKLPDGKPLPDSRLAAFTTRIQPLIDKMDAADRPAATRVASTIDLESLGHCSAGDRIKPLAHPPETTLQNHLLDNMFCVVASNSSA